MPIGCSSFFPSCLLHVQQASKYICTLYDYTIPRAETLHSKAMAVLNHAGVCLAYDTTWTYLKKLVDHADYSSQVRQGRWLWVYDNFNMHQTIRHERIPMLFISMHC